MTPYMSPMTSDMYAKAYHYDSNTCLPWRVTCAHEHTTTSQVCATYGITCHPRHVHTSTLLSLQCMPPTTSDIFAGVCHHDSDVCHPQRVTYMQERYMPPTTSDIYAKAYHHVSSVCHPRRVTCVEEHDAQNPGWTIPWSILQRAGKTQDPPSVSPTDSHHHVSSTCHFVRGTYARVRHNVSSTCHPQRVSCMQEHNTYVVRKTRQTQALRLVILTGS
ncbi:hypothetical protein HKD37_13G035725 [Glycine soja]